MGFCRRVRSPNILRKMGDAHTINIDNDSVNARPRVAVVGVGGTGCNVAEGFVKDLAPVNVIAVNIDEKSLSETVADRKVLLCGDVSKYARVQRDTAFGRRCARIHSDDISNALYGHDVVVIIAGMGEGVGTGAAPVVVEIARELNIMTLTIAIEPSSVGGSDRSAKDGLNALRSICPSTVTVQNDLVFEKFPGITATEALRRMNRGIQTFVKNKVKMISEIFEKEIYKVLLTHSLEKDPISVKPAITFV